MEQKFIALQTKTFEKGQALADIIKGHKYIGDRDGEWFIDEFGEKRYLAQCEFGLYFREVKGKKKSTKMNDGNTPFYMMFFAEKDQDIIDWLETKTTTLEEKIATKGSRGGKADYIRKLIREDIARNKQGQ